MRFEDLPNDFHNENSLENEFIVQIKKEYSKMRGESIKSIRENKCFICNESISGYCNSHSVPRFALKNIKGTGEIGTHFSVIEGFEEKVLGSSKGINNAGTFKLICRDCDKDFFKDYEELSNYDLEPTTKMLAQIELKNYLFYIYRRKIEYESYKRHIEQYTYEDENGKHITNEFFAETGDQASILIHSMALAKLDIEFFIKQATSVTSNLKESALSSIIYEILYFEIADYVVPLAYQGRIGLIFDLEDNKINEVVDVLDNYDLQDIHLAILPLKDKSIILMFTNAGNVYYKSFVEQFKGLKRNDKLSVINYLIFLYTEDYFISEKIDKKVKNSLKMAANVNFQFELDKPYEQLIPIYTLTKRTNIPNLLHKKHRIRAI